MDVILSQELCAQTASAFRCMQDAEFFQQLGRVLDFGESIVFDDVAKGEGELTEGTEENLIGMLWARA